MDGLPETQPNHSPQRMYRIWKRVSSSVTTWYTCLSKMKLFLWHHCALIWYETWKIYIKKMGTWNSCNINGGEENDDKYISHWTYFTSYLNEQDNVVGVHRQGISFHHTNHSTYPDNLKSRFLNLHRLSLKENSWNCIHINEKFSGCEMGIWNLIIYTSS